VDLRTLEPRGLGRRPERGYADRLEGVDGALDQRRLRPDDDQVAPLAPGGLGQCLRPGADVQGPGVGGDPGVARRAEQLADARRAR
jgi:hypothetical protein